MKHTPTPWMTQTTDFGYTTVFDQDGHTICETISPSRKPDFERIVECVNAMDGIEDPKKLRETYEACKELELDKYQSLKAAVVGILDEIENGYNLTPGSGLFIHLQNLIK